jgi:hypothetical protein
MAGGLLLANAAFATVSTIAYYRLGENDPGAVAGQPANAVTVGSSAAGVNLYQLGVPSVYDTNTGVTGSTLCIAVNGGGYTNGAPIAVPSTDWGIEAWVKATSGSNPLSSDGYASIAFNGNSYDSGMGLYATPDGNFVGLCSAVAIVGAAPIVPGAWTHLALVTMGGTTTFYVNGVVNGTGPAPNPVGLSSYGAGNPTTSFVSIGLNPSNPGGWEQFQGSIDEVRVFAFEGGAFTTNDLLLTSAPPPPQAPAIFAGPTPTPACAVVLGTNYVVAGAPFSLGVLVGGNGPVSYQWRTTTNLTGFTNATLFFANPTTNDGGNYSVVVTNAYGAVTSLVASVAVVPASTDIIPLAYYRLGENDPGAAPGQTADNSTRDIVNDLNLYQLGVPPVYDTNTGVRGSTFCIDVDGGGYTNGAPIPTPANWGIEAWVNATSASNLLSSDGYASIAYNGNSSQDGMGLYSTPDGNFVGLCGNVAIVGAAPIVPGAWTHLAIVTTRGTTTFYVNGAVNAVDTANPPLNPTGLFDIGINPGMPGGGEQFEGSIDEVRVFAVTPGLFTTNDLLLRQVPPGVTAAQVVAVPTLSTSFVPVGGNISVNVEASGTAPRYYQWYENGTAISGASAATLTLSNVTASAAFYVVVSNLYGSSTSAVVTVNVVPAGANGLTPLAYYRLGENDPGAEAGQPANAVTVDSSAAGVNLYQLGVPPDYDTNTGVAGSTFCIDVDGGGYTNGAPIAVPSTNWGIEAWVSATSTSNPLSSDGYASIAFNGNSYDSGMGLYATPGGNFVGLCGGVAIVGSGAPIVPGAWTHLALVTMGGTTTFYVNGVVNGTAPAPNPVGLSSYGAGNPTTSFVSIGLNPAMPGGGEQFQGSIDEVRVFAVVPALFTTNDLLLASAPPALSVGVVPSGTNIIILWSGETLQQAPGVAGPWTTITNVTAPWLAPMTGVSQFFRAAGQR